MINRLIDNYRIALKTCLTFTFLAIALTFGPLLFEPNVQAGDKQASPPRSQNSKAASQKPGGLTPAATGAISGTVTAAATSDPIQDVEVQIYDSSRNFITSQFTNSSGVYTTPAFLATGVYYAVTVNTSGYLDELYNNINCLAVSCNITSGTPISVTDGATTTGINFALAAGGRISGTVIDSATSAPLANVFVQIYRSDGQGVSNTFTDGSGHYVSGAGLPTGTYYAVTSNSIGYVNEVYDNIICFGCGVTVGTPISVTTGATTPGINFALAVGGRISGTVTDSTTGEPLPNVFISISDSNGAPVSWGFTNFAGNYTSFAGIPAGPHYARTFANAGYMNEVYNNIPCPQNCVPSSGTPLPITLGSTTPGINFALDGLTAITGTVTDASGSTPLPNIGVDIFDSTGNYLDTFFTDGAGNYSATGLTTGTYYAATFNLFGYLDEVYNNITCVQCNVTAGTPISVNAGSTTSNINFALSVGGFISGSVTNVVTGAPIEGINIGIYDTGGEFIAFANTDGSGNYFNERGLPTGTYYARTINSLSYIDILYKDITCLDCNVTSGTPISVTAGFFTTGIKFALRPGGRVSGAITNAATSLPLESIVVLIYDSGGNLVASTATGSSGSYITTTGLPTGTYYASTLNFAGLVDALYNNITCPGCTPTIGTAIPVTVGVTTPSINFSLCASFSLSQSSRLFGATGGEGGFAVTSTGGCGWAASSNAGWIEITSSSISPGNGTVTYLVRDNPSAAPRTGTISAANQTFTVTQAGRSAPACTFTTNPQFASFNSAGGSNSFTVTTPAGCAWSAESNRSWIIITSPCCDTNSGSVSYTVAPNVTGSSRSGVITIGGKKFNIKQK